jgi:hypothetical protein
VAHAKSTPPQTVEPVGGVAAKKIIFKVEA